MPASGPRASGTEQARGLAGSHSGAGSGNHDRGRRAGAGLEVDGAGVRPPLHALDERQEHAPQSGGVGPGGRGTASDHQLNVRPRERAGLEGLGCLQEVDRLRGELQRPGPDPSRVHQVGDHHLHAQRVVGDPLEHEAALVGV